jgi:hypothetical protein
MIFTPSLRLIQRRGERGSVNSRDDQNVAPLVIMFSI